VSKFRSLVRRIGAVLLVLVYGSACATMQSAKSGAQNNPKAVLGAVVGAGAGALVAGALGGRGWTVVAAALAGGLLGGAIGRRLDQKDKQMAAEAAHRAFESNRSGQESVWNNPDSGNHGSITPTKTRQLANGQYCREYRQDIWIGEEKEQTYGTACRQADGSWQVQPS
jgi:surface antigen